MAFRVLIDKKDLQIGETMVFDYTEVGIPRQGFLARLEDGWVAYENRCRHLPISLDMEDRKSTRLNSSHSQQSRMPSSA